MKTSIKKTVCLVLITALLPVYLVFAAPSLAASLASAWTTKGDFTNNAATVGTATNRSQVVVSGAGSSDNADVTLSADEFPTIAAGALHSLAIKSDGSLWAWGGNGQGQLGDGTNDGTSSPINIKPGATFKAVVAGDYYSLALKSDGSLWAWGQNDSGQLGDGTVAGTSNPVNIQPGATFKAIAAGALHSLAIKSDGSLWAWGGNGQGQLGDGTLVDKHAPVNIRPGATFKAVAGGSLHSLAIKSDGSLWTWGWNIAHQLGDGTTDNTSSPVNIQPGATFKAVAGGYLFSLALKSDGGLWAWGDNVYGQLGDGTTAYKATPVNIQPGTVFKAINAGDDYSLAIKSDGSRWAWGYNGYGQLGDATLDDQHAPVNVQPGATFKAVAASGLHTLALKSDGSLWACGRNASGELGDGTTNIKTSPVNIRPGVVWRSPLSYLSTGSISNLLINAGAGTIGKWASIVWNGARPAGTSIKFRTRAAATKAGLASASWSSYYSASGSAITTPSRQWLEIQAVLASTNGANTPTLNDFSVKWESKQLFFSLTAKPKKIQAGQAVVLKGRLQNVAGQAVRNAVIGIKKRVVKKKKLAYITLAKVKTNKRGNFTYRFRPNKTTLYKATFAGNKVYKAADSNIIRVVVK